MLCKRIYTNMAGDAALFNSNLANAEILRVSAIRKDCYKKICLMFYCPEYSFNIIINNN